MAIKAEIKEKIVTAIDWFVIEKVRQLRTSKFSQKQLSQEIGLSEGFIGRIENPNHKAVYNLRHLNLIANILQVNISELLPKQRIKEDLVKVTYRLMPPTRKSIGEINYEVLKVTPLTREQVSEYNKKTLNRPTKSGMPPKYKKRKSQMKK
jgi:transcriptional regulator with XRE-family HTH domain